MTDDLQPDAEPDDDAPVGARQLAIHAGLFAAACVTTSLFGGLWFSASLMTILVCHELGHYVVARRHHAPVSLPYFIPLPPQISLGTLGAVIKMRRPIADRNQLLDVGAAGPLAGLAVAIPLLFLGLSWSELAPIHPDGAQEGNSLLYGLAKLIVFGRWLPGGGVDVDLHPMAFAAWVGLLVTMINLIPIGQLDGGHVARAWLGDRHEVWSARLHLALPVIGGIVVGALTLIAHASGLGWGDAFVYSLQPALPWLLWAVLLLVMRRMGDGSYHPPVGDVPITAGRKRLAILVFVLWVLIFTPVPMRPTL
ncbi:MAG: site-2 protease family protein [Deltaproteobacteria bacterium]|nr:site-2 protease family protein [Deltaproteobacteria bacterium]